MNELRAKIRLSVEGKEEVKSLFDSGREASHRFRAQLSEDAKAVGRDMVTLGGQIARGLGALGGIGAGISIAENARSVMELRDAVAGLAANAGLAEGQLAPLREEINSAALASQQFGKDLAEALNTFVAKTGDIDQGRRNLELWGKVAKATRADVSEIAAIGAELSKLNIRDQSAAYAIQAKQADVGSVELRDLVSQGPRLFAAYPQAVARTLEIAETTVKIHVQGILRKLGLTSRVQAAVYATSHTGIRTSPSQV